MWRHYTGDIPEGYHVHHLNGDKDCNDFWNLSCIQGEKHCRYHTQKRAENDYEAMCENLRENATPKAAEWHGSEAGKAWHSEHAKKTIENLQEKRYECAHCGKIFYKKPLGSVKYCSNNCKTKARKASGVDDETRRCAVCGGDFVANKYTTTKYCSVECRNKVRGIKISNGMRG